jgi:hypothetical protein
MEEGDPVVFPEGRREGLLTHESELREGIKGLS